MRLISTLPLLAAAMPFAAGAVSIAVNATVDSHIASVTVKAESQTMTIAANGSATWTGWTVGVDYAPTFTGVADGYTGKWKATANGGSELSGGVRDSITLSQSYAGCTLSFYGEPNTYRVKFERQGGSGDVFVTATYDAAMPSITPPTRKGYEFCSYTTEPDGGVQYYNADGTSARTWDKTSEATLYAQWKPAANSVTLERRLGVGGTRSVVATYDAAMPAITPPTRKGYEFLGYYDSDNFKYYYADGTSAREWRKTEATTLYAKWSAIRSTVTLDPQEGSGGNPYVMATYGSPMPTADMPTRDNWIFKGFTSQPDGTGTQYYNAKGASARKWDQTADTTLYAQWTVRYAVTLDARDPYGRGNGVLATDDVGAAVSVITNIYTMGEPWNLPANPTNINKDLKFAGWTYTNSQGVLTDLDPTSPVPSPSAGTTNLIARWSNPLADAVDAPTLLFNTFGTYGDFLNAKNPTNAPWSVLADFEYNGTNVARSGELPISGDEDYYVSWLTTELRGKGTLTFWWKCVAPSGNQFSFGPCYTGGDFDVSKKIDFVGTDWMQQEYVKTSDTVETVAWVFLLYGGANGGGTGYVDRVTWEPKGEE